MKKLLFFAMAIASISFTSCNNQSTSTSEETDSVATEETEGLTEVTPDTFVKDLNTAISADDNEVSENSVLTALKGAKMQISDYMAEGNFEDAKVLAEKMKTFIEENKEKLISVAPAAKELIESIPGEFGETLQGITDALESKVLTEGQGLKEDVDNKINEAKETVKGEIESQKQAVEDAAKQKVEDAKNEAKQKAAEAIDNAAKDIKGKLGL